jgi:hypothetical protein
MFAIRYSSILKRLEFIPEASVRTFSFFLIIILSLASMLSYGATSVGSVKEISNSHPASHNITTDTSNARRSSPHAHSLSISESKPRHSVESESVNCHPNMHRTAKAHKKNNTLSSSQQLTLQSMQTSTTCISSCSASLVFFYVINPIDYSVERRLDTPQYAHGFLPETTQDSIYRPPRLS